MINPTSRPGAEGGVWGSYVDYLKGLEAEVAALRQQLDDARAERDELREREARYPVPGVATDLHDMVTEALRPYLSLVEGDDECWEVTVEGASGLADVALTALISAARLPGVADELVMFEYQHARAQVERFAERINAAEADRDRLLVVYRAAEAWRDGWGTDWTKALTPEGRRTESKILALINAVDAYRAEGPGGER